MKSGYDGAMSDSLPLVDTAAGMPCARCNRPLQSSTMMVAGLFYHVDCAPGFQPLSERQREEVRMIVLEVLRDLRALPVTIPGDL